MNKSSAAVSGSFPPILPYRKREIHTVFRPFRYFDWPENLSLTALADLIILFLKAAPHNSARSLSQDFCSNSKFRKWRNTVCISRFRNCGSGAKRRLRLADAIVRCCLNKMISSFYSAVSRQTAWAAVRNVLTSFFSGSGRNPAAE